MCGIAGYVDSEGSPPDEACVSRMAELLSHRGPDGRRFQTIASGPAGPTVVFGHTRLAIIDLSDAAAQPLTNEDGSVVLTYNGEIYNFRELRRELETRGHVFRSLSDTEVVVHAYESFGDEFVSHLDGMFAFALWDSKRRRLVLARDRAGKKPLYYVWDGRRLTFASEIKALRTCPWVDDGVAWERIPELLCFGYVPWPATLHRSILQVPPASYVVLENGTLSEPRAYWRLSFETAEDQRGTHRWPEAEETVRTHLRSAVERRLVADVPLGVLLSGGIDSSIIVALMAQAKAHIRTFTVGIDEEASYDERRFAREIAHHFATDHTEVVVRADAASLLEKLLWHLDQPLADSSAVPTYLIALAAREHVTVALTGDGGDEVFGGYERFAAALLAERLPPQVQRSLAVMTRLIPQTSGYHSLRRRLERFVVETGHQPHERYLSWVRLFGDDALAGVLDPAGIGVTEGMDPSSSFYSALAETGDAPLLHRLLYTNFRTYLHDDLLVKTDRMTMAASLEARCPFLDTQVIEAAAALSPALKTTPFGLKRILRRSFRGVLPPAILRRRKHGFGVPVDQWFRGKLKDPFQDLVLAPDTLLYAALQRNAVEGMFREHLEGRSHGARLWALLTLEVWLRMIKRPPAAPPAAASDIVRVE